MKILLAVDGSDFTKKMLAYLVTHDELFTTGNEYSVFTAQAALPARARAAVGKEVVDQFHKEEAEKFWGPSASFFFVMALMPRVPGRLGQPAKPSVNLLMQANSIC